MMKIIKVKNKVIVSLIVIALALSCMTFTSVTSPKIQASAAGVNTVAVTLNSSETVTLQGGGDYEVGAVAKINAPLKSGSKVFTAWKNGANEITTSSSYEFSVTEAVALTAVYEEKTNTVNVNVSKPLNNTSTAQCKVSAVGNAYNLVFTATVVESVFDGWYFNSKLVSQELTYQMPLNNVYLNSINMTAKFRGLNETAVRFMRDENIVVKTEYLQTVPCQITAPMAYKSGYTFSHWLQSGDVVTQIKAGDKIDIAGEQIYNAVFIANSLICEVTTVNCSIDKLSVNAFDVITATATDATNFSHYTINDKIVSYSPIYKFTVSDNIKIEAHAKSGNFTPKPSVYLSKNTKMEKVNDKYIIAPIATFVTPSNNKIMEKGLMLVENSSTDVNLLTPNAKKILSFNNKNGQLTGTYLNLDVTKAYATRAYLIYESNNNLYVEYSNQEKIEFVVYKGIAISTIDELIKMESNKQYYLTNDIDCASRANKAIFGDQYGAWQQEFKSSLDGDGHKLLNITGTNPWGVLCATFSGVLKNLYMQFSIQGNGDGSIIADTFNGEISNCVFNITANSSNRPDRLCLFTKTTTTTASFNDCVIIGNGNATIAIFAFNDAGCKPQDITYKNLVYIYSNLYDNVLNGETGKSVLPDKPIYCSKASEIYVYTLFANAVTANGRQLDEAAYKTSTKANVLTNWKTSTKNLSEAMNKTNILIDVNNILINGKIVYTNN